MRGIVLGMALMGLAGASTWAGEDELFFRQRGGAPKATLRDVGEGDMLFFNPDHGEASGVRDDERENEFFFHPDPGGALGVTIRDVGKDDIQSLKLSKEGGVIIRRVHPNGPASRAGLKEGDVILKCEGESIRSAAQFARLVRETPPGASLNLEIVRAGKTQAVTAAVEAAGPSALWNGGEPFRALQLPQPPDRRMFAKKFMFGGFPHRLGIQFQELSGQLAKYFHLAEDTGILIVSVDEEGPAFKAGLKAGDVLLKLNDKTIRDSEELVSVVESLEDAKTVEVTVQRDGKPLVLRLTLRAKERHTGNPTI